MVKRNGVNPPISLNYYCVLFHKSTKENNLVLKQFCNENESRSARRLWIVFLPCLPAILSEISFKYYLTKMIWIESVPRVLHRTYFNIVPTYLISYLITEFFAPLFPGTSQRVISVNIYLHRLERFVSVQHNNRRL